MDPGGDEPIEGKESFAALEEIMDNKTTELTIISIVIHGKECVVKGEMTLEHGSVYGFPDFLVSYLFF